MREAYTYTGDSRINIVFNQKRQENENVPPFAAEKKISHAPLEGLEGKLNRLVGLDKVKRMVRELYAWLYVNNRRKDMMMKVEKQTFHMLFKGNPGTGKTTVARLLGELFREMDILPSGHLIEAERADLVGEYIGQTAQKTRELVKKALGGILFIDEAYSLSRGGEKDFGREAVDTLVKQMEDHGGEFILILAGYPEEMDQFLIMNPGLPSRFPIMLSFPDFTGDELLEIAERMVKMRDYRMTAEAKKLLVRHLRRRALDHDDHFSNGRYVRNLIEKAIRRQAVRLVRENMFDRESLMTIRACDVNFDEERERAESDEASGKA